MQAKRRGGKTDAGLLCEVPRQEGDEKPQEHHDEEWQAGDPGHMPYMRHEDVQNWQGLGKR
jgi:hypothetical protein